MVNYTSAIVYLKQQGKQLKNQCTQTPGYKLQLYEKKMR